MLTKIAVYNVPSNPLQTKNMLDFEGFALLRIRKVNSYQCFGQHRTERSEITDNFLV